ncbi:c-type cytochrome [Pelagibius sp.]|uniref:c-type cytochrome n=1 Tax=Pelagibius sp. TaxID=1931238 RepID=UPI003BAF0D7E
MRSARSNSARKLGDPRDGQRRHGMVKIKDCLLLAGACLTAGLFWASLPLVPAAHGDEIAEGRALVAEHCLRCHAGPDAPYSTTAAPTLREMAQAADWSTLRFQAWLAADHPPMPQFILTSSEVYALRSYLSSMKSDSLLQPAF